MHIPRSPCNALEAVCSPGPESRSERTNPQPETESATKTSKALVASVWGGQLMDSVGREEDRTVCRYATVSQNTFLHITMSLARAYVDLHVWTCLQHHGACDLHAALGLAFQGVVLGLRGEGGSMDEDPRTPIRASFFLFNG